jgi:hypothetical protein
LSQNDLEWKLRIKVEGEKEADEKVNSIAQKAFESLNSKNFSLKEPGKEIKDFVEEHSKMFKQMRESKTLDIANLVWGKLNDPNASKSLLATTSNANTLQPKPSIILMNALPILPVPITPTVLPNKLKPNKPFNAKFCSLTRL